MVLQGSGCAVSESSVDAAGGDLRIKEALRPRPRDQGQPGDSPVQVSEKKVPTLRVKENTMTATL